MGSSIADFGRTKEMPPGYVQAFDVRTGKPLWTFHTIPRAGEFGYDTWLEDSAEYSGSTNVWAQMAYDPELDYVYLPTSTPTHNSYGGHRHGEQSLRREPRVPGSEDREARLALPDGSPRRVGLRPPGPTRPGRHHGQRPAHQGRHADQQAGVSPTSSIARTGEPVWPIEERPVPPSDVPGERTSPTQPFPTRPPAVRPAGRHRREPDRLHARAAAARADAAAQVRARSALHAAVGEGHVVRTRQHGRGKLGRRRVRSGDGRPLRRVPALAVGVPPDPGRSEADRLPVRGGRTGQAERADDGGRPPAVQAAVRPRDGHRHEQGRASVGVAARKRPPKPSAAEGVWRCRRSATASTAAVCS